MYQGKYNGQWIEIKFEHVGLTWYKTGTSPSFILK